MDLIDFGSGANTNTGDTVAQALVKIQTAILALEAGGGPVFAFTAEPVITTDGTPQLGETYVYARGTHNGPLGDFRIEKQNGPAWEDHADASIGSGSLPLGTFRLSEEIGTTGIKGYSDPITVTASAGVTMNPPVLSDPPGYTAGGNPPETLLTVDETIEKAQCKAEYFYDRNASGAFSYDNDRRTIFGETEADGLMGLFSGPSAALPIPPNLAAGAYREIIRITNKVTGEVVVSNMRVLTLSAPVMPDATTLFSFTNSNFLIKNSMAGADAIEIEGDVGWGVAHLAVANAARTDRRVWELEVTQVSVDPRPIWIGVVPDDPAQMPNVNPPAESVGTTVGDYATKEPVGTIYSFDCTPKVDDQDGVLIVKRNGVLVGTIPCSLTSYRLAVGPYQNNRIKLNTGPRDGQANPFAYVTAGVARYN